MREIKKDITRLLREVYPDVYFKNAVMDKRKYLVYDLMTIDYQEGIETLELQIDAWDKSTSSEWVDEIQYQLRKKLNNYHELNDRQHLIFFYDRTLTETTENNEWKRNTIFFHVKHLYTERV